MRNKKKGSRIVSQKALKPSDGVQIEVIGRLIKEQEIAGLGKKASQLQSSFFSSGKQRNVFLCIIFCETESAEDAPDF